MSCSQPPPIGEDQISAVIDGVADPAVLEHLARCPSCSARLAAAHQGEQLLLANLYRWDCLDPTRLADYTLSRLSPAESAQVEAHLLECAACSAEVADLQRFLSAELPAALPTPPAPAPPARPLRPLVARMAPPAQGLALRGEDSDLQIAEVETGTVILQLRRTEAGRATLIGQLIMEQQESWVGALVEVRQAGVAQAVTQVDALGGFVCAQLPAAPLELYIIHERLAPILIAQVAPADGAA
jgi:anti-sigma factor RsiW